MVLFFHVSLTQLKFPQGLNPNTIFIQFALYSDEMGTVDIHAVHQKGDYGRDVPIPKPKTWNIITVKLAELNKKELKDKGRPEADHLIKDIDIHVKPPKNKKITAAWIDDVLCDVMIAIIIRITTIITTITTNNSNNYIPQIFVSKKRYN